MNVAATNLLMYTQPKRYTHDRDADERCAASSLHVAIPCVRFVENCGTN